jgi:cytochrome c553
LRKVAHSVRASARWKAVLCAAFFCAITPWIQAQNISAKMALCAACHGADGNAPLQGVPSLAGQPKTFIENQLVMIREGMRNIPVMQGMLKAFSDEDITAMAVHYAALPLKKPGAERQAALFALGELKSQEMRCGICHLPNYMGRDQIPRLAGQREDYLLHSMQQFKSNQAVGRDTIMAASLYGVSDGDIKAMAHYLSRLSPNAP